jgi:hypothetical protein
VFFGFTLPILLSSLVLLCLRRHDMRWQPAPVAVFLGMLRVAAFCARYLSVVRMTRRATAGLAPATTVPAAAGTLMIVPGTTDRLAERVRAACIAGARVTVDVSRKGDAALSLTARDLFAGALAGLGADDVKLQVHPRPKDCRPCSCLRLHSARSGYLALRRTTIERGAVVSDLADHELLLRLQSSAERTAFPAA